MKRFLNRSFHFFPETWSLPDATVSPLTPSKLMHPGGSDSERPRTALADPSRPVLLGCGHAHRRSLLHGLFSAALGRASGVTLSKRNLKRLPSQSQDQSPVALSPMPLDPMASPASFPISFPTSNNPGLLVPPQVWYIRFYFPKMTAAIQPRMANFVCQLD